MNRKLSYAALATIGAFAFGFAACGNDETSELAAADTSSGDPGPTSGQGGAQVGVGVGEVGVGVGGQTNNAGTGGSCASVTVVPEFEYLPADIIFVIDNSGSMSDEIAAVEQNINVNFAAIIQASGVDYQVVMLTDHGSASLDVCIGPPLSGTTNCGGPPVEIPGQFAHYDLNVQSHDSPCLTLETLFGSTSEPDENGNYLNGWQAVLRPTAVKVFVQITDDGIVCNWNSISFNDQDQINPGQQFAIEWDQQLLSLSPVQFGTAANRNYLFYSIVGLPAKSNNEPYNEFEPVVTGNCTTPSVAYAPGTGYQWLSKGTGGLRFPVCSHPSYDAVFNDIAAGVVDVTAIPCEFDLPPAPPNEDYDLNTLRITYTPGGNGTPQQFVKVDSAALCMPGAFYVTGTDPYHVTLCPQACAVVEADDDAQIDASLDCGFVPI